LQSLFEFFLFALFLLTSLHFITTPQKLDMKALCSCQATKSKEAPLFCVLEEAQESLGWVRSAVKSD